MKEKNKISLTNKSTNNTNTKAPTHSEPLERLIPINAWPKFHAWPPAGGLRHIRFFAEEKGATDCFVKKGGRVLVKERTFLNWASTNDCA